LLEHEHEIHDRPAGPAVLLRNEESQVALLGEEADVLPRHFRVLVPACRAILEDFARELLRFALKHELLIVELEIHGG
jgi:hypothetical protein